MKKFRNTNYYKNKYFQKDRISNAIGKFDLAVFGSAYASYDFDFEGLDVRAHNFGFASQFMYYTDFFIDKFLPQVNVDGCVAIVLPPLALMETGENAYGGAESYVFICDKNYFNIPRYRLKKLMDSHRLLFCPWRLKYCFWDQPLDRRFLYSNELSDEQIENKVQSRIDSWNKKYHLFDKHDYTKCIEQTIPSLKMLNIIIKKIEADGKKCCLIIPPVAGVFREKIPERLMQVILYDRIKELGDVMLLDYWNDERFASKDLYVHIDFMNATGRKKFTAQVVSDLKENGFI